MKIIGMIHLDALLGYPHHKNMNEVIKNAKKDAEELIKGGVDKILIENTYDDPHTKTVGPEIVSAYTVVANEIRKITNKPLGICVLWNDHEAALSIAKVIGAEFVRVPVFIEACVTASGIIEANPYEIIKFRKHLDAQNIEIYADIHVKHAGHIAQRDLLDSVEEAISFGADKIIITGKKTGNEPIINELKNLREKIPNIKLVVGSGTTPNNVKEISKYVDEAIIGTYFKENGRNKNEKVKEITKLIHE